MKSLESNLSLVKSSNEIGISEPTVFSWRHKFLSSQEANYEEEKPVQTQKEKPTICEEDIAEFVIDENEISESDTKNQRLRDSTEKSNHTREHNYLQTIIKKLGQDNGFLSIIEKETKKGGKVDVSLESDKYKIACEISVTNKAEYELKNIQKCLEEGYNIVLMISKNEKHLNNIKNLANKSIAKSDLKKVFFIYPNEVSYFLNIPKKKEELKSEIVNGFRVTTEYTPEEHANVENIRENISRILIKKRNS